MIALYNLLVVFVEVFVVLVLLAIAYWKKSPELYLLVGIGAVIFGLEWATTSDFFFLGLFVVIVGVVTVLRCIATAVALWRARGEG